MRVTAEEKRKIAVLEERLAAALQATRPCTYRTVIAVRGFRFSDHATTIAAELLCSSLWSVTLDLLSFSTHPTCSCPGLSCFLLRDALQPSQGPPVFPSSIQLGDMLPKGRTTAELLQRLDEHRQATFAGANRMWMRLIRCNVRVFLCAESRI